MSYLKKSMLHGYQKRAVKFITKNKRVALFLDMGLGKTISTLTAIQKLKKKGEVKKVLIIAPLRVCNTVWEQEAKKWKHTKDLTFVNLAGGIKQIRDGVHKEADVYLINRENVKKLTDIIFNFDMVVIDESSSFKSHRSLRFKALKDVIHIPKYVVLLTGTPSPNGYMDLWSQYYLLDFGERLEPYITYYRNKYFDEDYMGYNYVLKIGAKKKIKRKIKDITLSMSAKDYLELPDKIDIVMKNNLHGDLLNKYNELKKDMLLEINENEVIEASTAATVSNKLLQFSSGDIYDENKKVHHFHDLKIDMLKEIIEDNPNENLLVVYNYKHELDKILKHFKDAVVLSKEGKEVDRWNKGEIKMLLVHPASASMGINLQEGGHVIVWYGFTWNLEYYQQMNARLHRQGQKNTVKIIHLAVGTIEEKLMEKISQKEISQNDLLESLKKELVDK